MTQAVQMIDHTQFTAGLLGIMNSAQVGEKGEFKCRVVHKKADHLKIIILMNCNGEQSGRL